MESREYGIDFLRFVATLGVIILHVFGINNTIHTNGGYSLVNLYFSNFLCIIFMCSVNVFGLLTGYLYSERNTYKYISIIRLIFEVIFYSALITILVLFIRPEWITGKKELLESLFPFGTRLWYITAYIFVFCMIPYLNVFIQNCSKTAFRNLLFVLFLLFSLCTTFGLKDFFGIAMGGSCGVIQ